MSIAQLSSALMVMSALGAALAVTALSRRQYQHTAALISHGEKTLAELDDAVHEIARLARNGRKLAASRPPSEPEVVWLPRQAVNRDS